MHASTTKPFFGRRPPIITIVDDDAAVRSSLKFALELEGFDVRTFGSAADLLGTDNVGASTCFVIDQRMPEMTGLELISKLRDMNVLTPALLLVSYPNLAVSTRAAAANIPIVEKPLLGNILVDKIREACGE